MKRKLLPAGAGTALSAWPCRHRRWPTRSTPPNNGVLGESVPINTLWVVISAVLVLLMLAGLLSSRPACRA